jgi:hypothetical protein
MTLVLVSLRQGNGLFHLDPYHSLPAVPLRSFMGEPAPTPTLGVAHGGRTQDDRRALIPEAYAWPHNCVQHARRTWRISGTMQSSPLDLDAP